MPCTLHCDRRDWTTSSKIRCIYSWSWFEQESCMDICGVTAHSVAAQALGRVSVVSLPAGRVLTAILPSLSGLKCQGSWSRNFTFASLIAVCDLDTDFVVWDDIAYVLWWSPGTQRLGLVGAMVRRWWKVVHAPCNAGAQYCAAEFYGESALDSHVMVKLATW